MDVDKRIEIDDLPRAQEELTGDEAKNVQGGLTKIGAGTLSLGNNTSNAAAGNTIGGALGSDVLNTTRKSGDGSV